MLSQQPSAHSEVVSSLVFSPHVAHLLASTSGDNDAALWDTRTGLDKIATLTHHRSPTNHTLFHPHRDCGLLVASDDRTISMWDLRRTNTPVGVVRGFGEGINKMLLLPPPPPTAPAVAAMGAAEFITVASACDDGQVYIHAISNIFCDLPEGTDEGSLSVVLDRFVVSMSTVNDLVLAPNPHILLTASEDSAIRSWRLMYDPQVSYDNRLIASLDEFQNPVNHLAIVPDGLIPSVRGSGAMPHTIAATNANSTSGSDSGASDGAAGGGGAAGVEPSSPMTEEDGSCCWVLAASSENAFGVDLAVQSGEFGSGARSYAGHRDYIRGLEFTREGTLLTVSDDCTAMEWSLARCEPIRQVKLHEGMVMASALSADGSVLATGTDGGEIRLWSLPFRTEVMGSTA